MTPRAIWYIDEPPGVALRPASLGEGDLLLEAVASGLSRGTESTVAAARVPHGEWQRMAVPGQEGGFGLPVKYGYACVARVLEGPGELLDRLVFTMHPHQTLFRRHREAVHLLPRDLPVRRATLAANMETALNAIWDARLPPGAPVAVIGGGTVGCLVASLARRIAKADVTLVDKIETRARTASELRVSFACGAAGLRDLHTVFHTSGSAQGLSDAIHALGFEGQVIELSWYGDREVPVPLGGAFHALRLSIRCSQVGHVAAPRRASTTHAERMRTAIGLLDDPALDTLLTHDIAFDDAPRALPPLLAGDPQAIAATIRY